MKHSSVIFGQDLYDIQFVDVEAFFAQQKDENLHLEFKSYVAQGDHAQKEYAIKKSVCALLNSEGGIIIWGAPIEIRDANGNTSVFIIEVEKSGKRPHQFDNKYFVRLDGQTRIAPHYLISALMKSTDFPILRGHIRLKYIRVQGDVFLTFGKLLFNTSIYNNDINIRIRLIVTPGNIIINHNNQGSSFIQDFPIISNGAPLMSDFILRIPIQRAADEINIILQFGGEKSPSKVSRYKYTLGNNFAVGDIQDESIYLVEKSENKLPSDISNNSIEDNINALLNQ